MDSTPKQTPAIAEPVEDVQATGARIDGLVRRVGQLSERVMDLEDERATLIAELGRRASGALLLAAALERIMAAAPEDLAKVVDELRQGPPAPSIVPN